MIGRREFITLLGGTAAWPFTARAQQPNRIRKIAIQMSGAEADREMQARVSALRSGLQELGWIEGHNYQFEHRWPANNPELIKNQAVELAALAPDVLVVGTALAVSTLRRETSTIPIVFVNVGDPVGGGLISSLAGTGSNITGFTAFEYKTAGKWLELLKEIAPQVARVAFVFGGAEFGPTGEGFYRAISGVAPSFAIDLIPIRVGSRADIEREIEAFADTPNGGLVAAADGGATNNRATILRAAERHRLPGVYPFRYWATDGGLAVYGVDLMYQYRRAATYVDRILRGTNPADLPVQAPDKFELIVNLKTAKSIGVEIPPLLLARADEVIE
jgi:putative tryptophan/tyrosine transport system substrate-binding protein